MTCRKTWKETNCCPLQLTVVWRLHFTNENLTHLAISWKWYHEYFFILLIHPSSINNCKFPFTCWTSAGALMKNIKLHLKSVPCYHTITERGWSRGWVDSQKRTTHLGRYAAPRKRKEQPYKLMWLERLMRMTWEFCGHQVQTAISVPRTYPNADL